MILDDSVKKCIIYILSIKYILYDIHIRHRLLRGCLIFVYTDEKIDFCLCWHLQHGLLSMPCRPSKILAQYRAIETEIKNKKLSPPMSLVQWQCQDSNKYQSEILKILICIFLVKYYFYFNRLDWIYFGRSSFESDTINDESSHSLFYFSSEYDEQRWNDSFSNLNR